MLKRLVKSSVSSGSPLNPKSWTTVPFGNYFPRLGWAGSRYIASFTTDSSVSASTAYTAKTSEDGITWTTNNSFVAAAGSRFCEEFCNIPGTFTGYALANPNNGSSDQNNGAYLLRSTDGGVTWTRVLTTPNGRAQRIQYVNGKLFILLGSSDSGFPSRVGVSDDGANWTWSVLDSNSVSGQNNVRFAYQSGMCFVNGTYMILSYKFSLRSDFNGYDGDFKTFTSTDGVNWTFSNPLNSTQLGAISQTYLASADIFNANGRFVALRNAETFNRIAYSPVNSFSSWTSGNILGAGFGLTSFQSLRVETVLGGFLMTIGSSSGSGDMMFKSTDGLSWAPISPAPSIGNNGITSYTVGNKILIYAGGNIHVGDY